MAELNDTLVTGVVTQTEPATESGHLMRFGEFSTQFAAFVSAYAHAPVTVVSTDSVILNLSGQQLAPTARLASGAALVPGRGAIAVASGSGAGMYVVHGTTAYETAAGNHSHADASDSAPGFLSPALFSKLTAIEAEATANEADGFLLNRDNHTGQQGWSSIYDFAAGVGEVALPLVGGTVTGLVAFSGEGMLRMPNVTEEDRDLLTPQPGWKIFNITQGWGETWSGLEWLPEGGAVAASVDFTSIYNHLQVSSEGYAVIQPGVVELSHMASMPTARILMRSASGLGAPEYGTAAEARALLNVANGATANLADAALLDRGNHTGYSYSASIADFAEAVAAITISSEAGGNLEAPLTFSGSDNYGIRLARLTTSEIDALGLTSSDKGVMVYNATLNQAEMQTPSGRAVFLLSGDGGNLLARDGSVAGTGRQELLQLNLTDPSLLTINDGVVTVTQGFHRIQPDTANGYYELTAIYGAQVGDMLEFLPEPGQPIFTIVHGHTNIQCATGDDFVVGQVYDRVSCLYDHTGSWRCAKVGVGAAAEGGGGVTLPVTDTTALVKDPGDATKQVGLDAGAASTGTSRFIQSPDGDSRVRHEFTFMVFDEDTAVDAIVHWWMNMASPFVIERFVASVADASGVATSPRFELKKNAGSIATVTVGTSGHGTSRYGSTTTITPATLAIGDKMEVVAQETGAASAGTAAMGLVVTMVGYFAHE